MIIRRCSVKDISEIYEIERLSFIDSMKRETMEKDLERESYFCYALWEEKAVSFISYEKVFDEGQIISVATHPDFRERGFGKKLFGHVKKLAVADEIKIFTLEVRSDNTPAIALYKKMGFKEVGRRKGYYKNPDSDAILMDLNMGDE